MNATPHHHFSEEENKKWLAELPKKSIAIKVIIKSEQGSVLLVKPNYKPTWQFPGGGVEPFEDPKDAAVRELEEELGLQIRRDDLQLIDSVLRKEHDNLILIYSYAPNISEDIELRYQEDELEGYKFEKPDKITEQISDYYRDFWEKVK